MIEISKWLFYFILIFLILVQFPLSYILGMLLGEITLRRRRRMGHLIPTPNNHAAPKQHKDSYNRAHPTTITQLIEGNPNDSRDNNPNKEGKNKQSILILLRHSFFSFPKICISAELFKRLRLFITGFGLASFFFFTLFTWAECPIWMKVIWVLILLGTLYFSWDLTMTKRSQTDETKSSPNSYHRPVVEAKVASNTYDEPNYSQPQSSTLHRKLLCCFPMRLYRLLKSKSTKNERNQASMRLFNNWGVQRGPSSEGLGDSGG